MRDIQNSNGFSNLQPKAKTESMAGTSSLTRVDYRSYRDFLESYQDNKNVKDDQESISSTDSGISTYKFWENRSNNTSTSSLNSETNGNSTKMVHKPDSAITFSNRTGSFRNYLDNYNNKRFSSVKPTLTTKSNVVKTEISIQVNGSVDKSSDIGDDQVDDSGYISPCTESDLPNFPPPPPLVEELNDTAEQCLAPPPPPPLPILPPPSQISPSKKWKTVKPENGRTYSTLNEKLPEANDAAANLAKILTQHLLPRRQALEELEKANEQNKGSISPPVLSKCAPSFNYIPVAPKMPQLPKNQVIPKQSEFVISKVSNERGNVDYNTTTVVPVTDTSAKIKKSDPNVRKLVYNTYRGFLGAYNNKANDMIATLPRTMVKEDQGINKQLESIALQGGLEKLNGRINPNVEQE